MPLTSCATSSACSPGSVEVRARGFTLIELLAAIAVLAVLGAMAFRGLGSILEAESRVQAETRRWGDVALALSQMNEDVLLAVGRTVQDAAGRQAPALRVGAAALERAAGDDAPLVLTRLGSGEGAAAQSAPRRVGYRVREGILEYLAWPALDVAPAAVPQAYTLLDGVQRLQVEALDEGGQWRAAWPAGPAADALPRALRIRLVLAGGEDITRILALK